MTPTEQRLLTCRIPHGATRDFAFLLHSELSMFSGDPPALDKSGVDALRCFFARDAHGVGLPCREPIKLQHVLNQKENWNLQIALWAEDVADGMLLRQSELVDYCHGLPEWIFEATLRQAAMLAEKQIGWTPRFARLEKVHSQWWPPEMDSFDWEI